MSEYNGLTVGVLALQGAFEEHQKHLESFGCTTRQVSSLAAKTRCFFFIESFFIIFLTICDF